MSKVTERHQRDMKRQEEKENIVNFLWKLSKMLASLFAFITTVLCWVAQLCPTLFDAMELARLLCPQGFSSKNTGVGCHALPPGDLSNSGIKPRSPAVQANALTTGKPPGKPNNLLKINKFKNKNTILVAWIVSPAKRYVLKSSFCECDLVGNRIFADVMRLTILGWVCPQSSDWYPYRRKDRGHLTEIQKRRP